MTRAQHHQPFPAAATDGLTLTPLPYSQCPSPCSSRGRSLRLRNPSTYSLWGCHTQAAGDGGPSPIAGGPRPAPYSPSCVTAPISRAGAAPCPSLQRNTNSQASPWSGPPPIGLTPRPDPPPGGPRPSPPTPSRPAGPSPGEGARGPRSRRLVPPCFPAARPARRPPEPPGGRPRPGQARPGPARRPPASSGECGLLRPNPRPPCRPQSLGLDFYGSPGSGAPLRRGGVGGGGGGALRDGLEPRSASGPAGPRGSGRAPTALPGLPTARPTRLAAP